MADQSNVVLAMLEGVRDDVQEVRSDVQKIREALHGNGATGLTTRVDRIERWRERAKKREDTEQAREYESEQTWQDRAWDVVRMIAAVMIGSLISVFGLGAL